MTISFHSGWPAFLAVLAALLCLAALTPGCAQPKKSPCAGLVYKDYGLSREEYGACARAMVDQLDRMHQSLLVLGDATRPQQKRLDARQVCFNAGGALGQLMREAGGTEKLVHLSWADEQLSAFNLDVVSARSVYTTYCYYGLTRPEVLQIDPRHEAARAVSAALP